MPLRWQGSLACGHKAAMRTRQSICARKKRFLSAGEARAAAAAFALPLLPYRCDRCRLFHLTSRTKGKLAARNALAVKDEPESAADGPEAEEQQEG